MKKADQVQQLTLQLEQEKAKNRELQLVQTVVEVGIRALSLRMLTTFVLVADSVMFAAALYVGTWQAILAAVLFAIAGWSVLFLKPNERKANETET